MSGVVTVEIKDIILLRLLVKQIG
jgi:hypothetical protein